MSTDLLDTDIMDRLRARTTDVHARLERDLDLLRMPLSRARFTAIVSRFYGFYAVWEPAVEALPAMRSEAQTRRKLHALIRDLNALNVPDVDALPLCHAATDLCTAPARAMGAMYVVEGSTLGGQFITRALSTAPWRPPGGLTFFDSYGASTGAMWRGFKDWMREACPRAQWRDAEQGAHAAFTLMHQWLTPELPA